MPRSGRAPDWTAPRSGASAPRIPRSGSSRSPSAAPAMSPSPPTR
jgi:hypothetical protein